MSHTLCVPEVVELDQANAHHQIGEMIIQYNVEVAQVNLKAIAKVLDLSLWA